MCCRSLFKLAYISEVRSVQQQVNAHVHVRMQMIPRQWSNGCYAVVYAKHSTRLKLGKWNSLALIRRLLFELLSNRVNLLTMRLSSEQSLENTRPSSVISTS
jgi:hypothetical protein